MVQCLFYVCYIIATLLVLYYIILNYFKHIFYQRIFNYLYDFKIMCLIFAIHKWSLACAGAATIRYLFYILDEQFQ